MQVIIGCVDGHTYKSDYHSDEEVQAELDAQDGYVGTGDLKDQQFTIDDMLVIFNDIVYNGKMNGSKVDNAYITLEIGGRGIKFKAEHIIWIDVIRDHTES
jgi:hypothetical protein